MASQEDITRALEDAVEVTRTAIPVDELADDPVGQFLLQEEAEPYARFLRDKTSIQQIPIHVSLVEGEASQLWFSRLGDWSGLGGDWCLYGGYWVRGVREVGAAGAAPKIEAYSPQQIRRALTNLKLSGLEKTLLEELGTQ